MQALLKLQALSYLRVAWRPRTVCLRVVRKKVCGVREKVCGVKAYGMGAMAALT